MAKFDARHLNQTGIGKIKISNIAFIAAVAGLTVKRKTMTSARSFYKLARLMKYFLLSETSDLPAIGHFAPFKAVLAVEENVSRTRQAEIAQWLVESGGKYVMICGANDAGWEDSIRKANLEHVDIEVMQPDEFVMITTHRHEKLRSTYWHAKKHARHTHVKTENILTIHLGNRNRSVEYLAIFEKA